MFVPRSRIRIGAISEGRQVIGHERDDIARTDEQEVDALPGHVVGYPPLDSMLELFDWYRRNLCQPELKDCRGYRVLFREEDFIHLVKLTDRFGKEPKNRSMTVANIRSGQLKIFHGGKHSPPNYCLQRVRDLVLARGLIESPDMIVANWQPIARGNPGDAYIRNFGNCNRPRYRVLICGYGGLRRLPITIFPRQHFGEREIARKLWP